MVSDVVEIDKIIGMPVLSRTSGNNLGKVYDLYIDTAQGVLMGLTVQAPNGKFGGIDYKNVFSFGHDAVMINDESEVTLLTEEWINQHPHAKKHLIGANVVTEGGNNLGEIGHVYVRLTSQPLVIYEMHGSMWDSLLGRKSFIYASSTGALSSNAERIIVPDVVFNNAASSLTELINRPVSNANRTAHGNSAV